MTFDPAPAGAQISWQSRGRPERGERSDTATWLLCEVQGHRFALPLSSVIETMRMMPLNTVAGGPQMVLGVAIIRGKPVPVVDAAFLFGGQSSHCERLVTVRIGDRAVALAVQSIVGTRNFSSRGNELPPLLHEAEAFAGLQMLDRDLYFLLDAARAVPSDVFDHATAGEGEA
jgi:purine-binding chemotaxis protein CheW